MWQALLKQIEVLGDLFREAEEWTWNYLTTQSEKPSFGGSGVARPDPQDLVSKQHPLISRLERSCHLKHWELVAGVGAPSSCHCPVGSGATPVRVRWGFPPPSAGHIDPSVVEQEEFELVALRRSLCWTKYPAEAALSGDLT